MFPLARQKGKFWSFHYLRSLGELWKYSNILSYATNQGTVPFSLLPLSLRPCARTLVLCARTNRHSSFLLSRPARTHGPSARSSSNVCNGFNKWTVRKLSLPLIDVFLHGAVVIDEPYVSSISHRCYPTCLVLCSAVSALSPSL